MEQKLPRKHKRRFPSVMEFIALMAAMMAMVSLPIDITLPAFPTLTRDFSLAGANTAQTTVTIYTLGFALGQMFYGPLSDALGRKPLLMVGFAVSCLASLFIVFNSNFTFLLVGRFFQGVGCAAPRIIAIAVIRDMFGGRRMAKVMSTIITVFVLAPMFAPSIGGVLLALGDWRWIFWFLFVVSLAVMLWTNLRLPETKPSYKRKSFSMAAMAEAFAAMLAIRQTLGYSLAIMFMFGCLLSWITSAQQIFADIYDVHGSFPAFFAMIAGCAAVGSFVNNRLVMRLGTRLLSHSALIGIIAMGALLVLLASAGVVPLVGFCIMIGAILFAYALAVSNFTPLAMHKVGHISGMASSFIGFTQTAGGGVLGYLVGQAYNHTIIPMTLGFVVFGLASLLSILFAEKGRFMNTSRGE
ncbi:MAG: multidrug effflux MFS transporter [Hyphomicrobiales bacterium]